MWQHWPGGELFRQPPPWAAASTLVSIMASNDKKIISRFIFPSFGCHFTQRNSISWFWFAMTAPVVIAVPEPYPVTAAPPGIGVMLAFIVP